MNCHHSYFSILVLSLALGTGFAIAGPGHDHRHDESPATVAGPASPRFDAYSDVFEAVGVLEGGELSVFVDRYASNEPVLKAKVELESGEVKAVGEFHADRGDYSFAATSFATPGSHPITLTITAGDDIDVLAGNLVVPDAHADRGHEEAPPWRDHVGTWGFSGAMLLVLALVAIRVMKRRNAGGLK